MYSCPRSTPSATYIAHLGHLQDDESDLIYMRARYYEPSVGRFISEDPAMYSNNWFVYCGNDPVQKCDPRGKEQTIGGTAAVGAISGALAAMGVDITLQLLGGKPYNLVQTLVAGLLGAVTGGIGGALEAAVAAGMTKSMIAAVIAKSIGRYGGGLAGALSGLALRQAAAMLEQMDWDQWDLVNVRDHPGLQSAYDTHGVPY